MRVRDACLIVAWAQQWEMKSQFDGDQNKIISCKKKGYLACFTTLPGIYGSDGDSIPSLFISNDGKFMFHSSVNNNFNHGLDIDFELNTMYNVSIGQQIDEDGKYWYEILIDGDSKLKIENKNHRSYTNVKLYASDSFVDPFISNFGSICQVKIQPEPEPIIRLDG